MTTDETETLEARSPARWAPWLLGGMYLVYYLVVGPFQLVLKPRCEEIGLGASAGAWAIGFLYGVLGVSRLAAGPVTEWLNARRTLAVAGGLLLATIAVTFNVATMPLLLLGMTFLGLASALLWSAGGAMALALAEDGRHGTAASRLYVFTGLGLLGGALSVDLFVSGDVPYTSAGFTWLQVVWLALAALAVALAVGLPGVARGAATLSHPKAVLRRLWHTGGASVFALLAGAAISYGAFYSLVTGLIADVPAVRAWLGTVSLPLYGIMAFSSLVVGPLADRIGRRPVLLQGMLAGGLGFSLLFGIAMRMEAAPWLAWLLIGGGGLALGWCFASVQTAAMAWIGDTMPKAERATAIGLIFVGRDLGVTAAASATVGLVSLGASLGWTGGDGRRLALLVFALALVLLAPLAWRLRAHRDAPKP